MTRWVFVVVSASQCCMGYRSSNCLFAFGGAPFGVLGSVLDGMV